jgi:outer membrane protein assembly factor BamB
MNARTLALAVMLVSVGPVAAGDWPQWLGPDRDGSSPETIGIWKEAPKVLWRVPVGEGHSSPVVAGGKVYLHTRVKDKEEESVEAFDAAEGKPLWQKTYPRGSFSSVFGLGPRATPAVAGGKVFTLGVTGILTAWEADSGKELWRVDTLKEFKAANLFFGVSASPLVDGGRVLVMPGGKGGSLAALEGDSGKVAWQTGDSPASYASPIITKSNESRQAVFFTGAGLSAVAPDAGKPLWEFPFRDDLNESSTTPVRAGNLLIASTVTKGSVALTLTEKDGKPAVEKKWANPALNCYFSTPVTVGKDHLFMVTGKASLLNAEVTLRCVEAATGKEVWSKPKVGRYHAALLRLADGKLLLHGDDGMLRLLAPNVEKYEELSASKVCGKTWAHPALANGRLYLRDEKELICLEAKAK